MPLSDRYEKMSTTSNFENSNNMHLMKERGWDQQANMRKRRKQAKLKKII